MYKNENYSSIITKKKKEECLWFCKGTNEFSENKIICPLLKIIKVKRQEVEKTKRIGYK